MERKEGELSAGEDWPCGVDTSIHELMKIVIGADAAQGRHNPLRLWLSSVLWPWQVTL